MNPTTKQDLTRLVAGLLYPSESDEPFEVVELPPGADPSHPETISNPLGLPSAGPVKTTTVEKFFADIHGGEQDVQLDTLAAYLRQNFTDLTVLRIGNINVTVLVLGRDSTGTWGGLRTTSVET
ncbi:MAG: nuclease A inhibitor family protein [Planctomycetales bacterium]